MDKFYSRICGELVEEALAVMPVVVLSGARQTGKTTLVDQQFKEKRRYYTLDQIDILEQAKKDPDSLLAELPVTIDEVQRAPELLLAVKRKVDAKRIPGSILLTSSANLMLMERVTESLAGRAIYLSLPPFCPLEWREQKSLDLIDALFKEDFNPLSWPHHSTAHWENWLLKGGYPSAIQIESPASRNFWFTGYIQTYLERDLRQLANVVNLADFQQLMRLTANRVGRLINQSEIARDAKIPQASCHRYLNLLETGCQVARLPNFGSSQSLTQQFVKAKKLMWTDCGLAASLAGIKDAEDLRNRPDIGFWLEQAVYQTLQTWQSLSLNRRIFYWRNKNGYEVDFILEDSGQYVGLEIKSNSVLQSSDLQGLRAFQQSSRMNDKLPRTALLNFCTEGRPLSDNAFVLPLSAFFPA